MSDPADNSPRRSRAHHRRRLRVSRKPPAQPPGTPVYSGPHTSEKTNISVFKYDTQQLEAITTSTTGECLRFQNPDRVTWLHVTGLQEVEKISHLGQCFGLHPLLIEDVLNSNSRSKLDQEDHWLFVTLRILSYDEQNGRIEDQHFSLYAAPNLVLSFCEIPTTVFNPVFQRLREGTGRIRTMAADYLLWALLDAIVDHYFAIIDALDVKLDAIDHGLLDGFDDIEIQQLYRARTEVVAFHRQIRPIREIVSQLSHSDSPVLSNATNIFFRDLYDHAIHALDQTDDLRELANGLRDYFLASVNNRMNEIMKVLTCVSVIFLPLTFLAGMYGMNFKHMPELDWPLGYPLVWLACALIAGGMLWIFRRRKWL